MVNFICKDCGYKFESKLDQKGRRCPYCGEPKIVKEPAAEELLNEE